LTVPAGVAAQHGQRDDPARCEGASEPCLRREKCRLTTRRGVCVRGRRLSHCASVPATLIHPSSPPFNPRPSSSPDNPHPSSSSPHRRVPGAGPRGAGYGRPGGVRGHEGRAVLGQRGGGRGSRARHGAAASGHSVRQGGAPIRGGKGANRDRRGFGGRRVTRPFRDAQLAPLDVIVVARTHMYTYATYVWDLCLVQGPFSVAPNQPLALRFATVSSPYAQPGTPPPASGSLVVLSVFCTGGGGWAAGG
jgi:hypothetical protein